MAETFLYMVKAKYHITRGRWEEGTRDARGRCATIKNVKRAHIIDVSHSVFLGVHTRSTPVPSFHPYAEGVLNVLRHASGRRTDGWRAASTFTPSSLGNDTRGDPEKDSSVHTCFPRLPLPTLVLHVSQRVVVC